MIKKKGRISFELGFWSWVLIICGILLWLSITYLSVSKSIQIQFKGEDYVSNGVSLKQNTINSIEELGVDMEQLTNKYGHPCVVVDSISRDINLYCFDELNANETNSLIYNMAKNSFRTFPELKLGFLHYYVYCLHNDVSGALVFEKYRYSIIYKNGELVYQDIHKRTCGKSFGSEDKYTFRNRTWHNI